MTPNARSKWSLLHLANLTQCSKFERGRTRRRVVSGGWAPQSPFLLPSSFWQYFHFSDMIANRGLPLSAIEFCPVVPFLLPIRGPNGTLERHISVPRAVKYRLLRPACAVVAWRALVALSFPTHGSQASPELDVG